MKGRRAAFLVLAAMCLGAGLYSGDQIYYLILFILAGTAILSLVMVLIPLLRLRYVQTLTPDTGVKGQSVTLRMEIHNDYPFPFPLVVLNYALPEDWRPEAAPSQAAAVLPRSVYRLEKVIPCRFRGRYAVGLRAARFTDLFGLYAFTLRFDRRSSYKPLTLWVKPRVVPLPYLPLPVRENEGPARSRLHSSGDMTQMSEPRPYQDGDPLRKIHWKLTLRTRELIVKNYEQSNLPHVALYLDCRDTGLSGVERAALEDMLVECATAVSGYVLERRFSLRLITYGPGRAELSAQRPEDFPLLYDTLSEIAFDCPYPLDEILLWELPYIARQGCLFIVAQELTASCFDTLMLLRRSGVAATVILVHVPQKEWDVGMDRMIAELRDSHIAVVVMTPFENLADKVEALR